MTRPQPPTPLRTALRLIVCCVIVFGLLVIPALAFAPVFEWWRDSDDFMANLSLGLICSLIAWLFVAVFHLSKDKVLVPVADPKTFLEQMRVLLDEMGYELVGQTEDTLFTRPRFNAFLFGGGVRVCLDISRGVLIGPKISCEILRRRLRMVHHFFRVHGVLEGQKRNPEQLLKRIEITLRLKPEQLADVRSAVLDPLSKTSTVVCDLHILVQSDQGVRESTIEQQVRPWAQKNDIACDIHKHHSVYHESSINTESMIMSGMFNSRS